MTAREIYDLIRQVQSQHPDALNEEIASLVVGLIPEDQLRETCQFLILFHVGQVERFRKQEVTASPPLTSEARIEPDRMSGLRKRDSVTSAQRTALSQTVARVQTIIQENAMRLSLGDLMITEYLDKKFYPHGVETFGRDLTSEDHAWLAASHTPAIAGQIERAAWHAAVARVMSEQRAGVMADLLSA